MSGGRGKGLLLGYLKQLDERVNVKLLLQAWGPRFEFVVRLLVVATFLDDSFRAATHFSKHTDQIGERGYLKPLAATLPNLVSAIATVVLGVGLLAQSLGSLCLLVLAIGLAVRELMRGVMNVRFLQLFKPHLRSLAKAGIAAEKGSACSRA